MKNALDVGLIHAQEFQVLDGTVITNEDTKGDGALSRLVLVAIHAEFVVRVTHQDVFQERRHLFRLLVTFHSYL